MNILELITEEKIQRHLDALAQIGNLGNSLEDGFLRASWSSEESAAMKYIEGVALEQGFSSKYDQIGNLILSFGPSNEVLQVGSHLDTVVNGGLFDGGAGIVAGLEALIALSKLDSLNKGLELIIWRGEEGGTFEIPFKGSKAAFGLLSPESLKTTFRGKGLKQAIEEQGFNPELIAKQQPSLTQEWIERITAHVELHIEQSTKLEIDNDDIGVVTSIRGPKRFRIELFGEAGHSGATPMGVKYRRDANLAMAYIQVRLDELANKFISEGNDLVQTIGIINSDPDFNSRNQEIYNSGITKICPYAYFSLDIRSNSNQSLEEYSEAAISLIEKTASDYMIRTKTTPLSSSKALENMDAGLQDLFMHTAQKISLRAQLMPSGAGHDVGIVAQQQKSDSSKVPSLLIFIPCREGISHNPLEFASTKSITAGARLIAAAYQVLAID